MSNNFNEISFVFSKVLFSLQEKINIFSSVIDVDKFIDIIIDEILCSSSMFSEINKDFIKMNICNYILKNDFDGSFLCQWATENIVKYKNNKLFFGEINKKVEIRNFNIKSYALDSIPSEFSILQKVKLIYNRINSVLVYDPIGIYVETFEDNLLNIKLRNRKVDISCLDSTYGVCYDWAKIFSQLLDELDVKNNIIFAVCHGFVIFEIDMHYYFADATKVFDQLTDLTRANNNLVSAGFFEISKQMYDSFLEYPEEMSQNNQSKYMTAFKDKLFKLDDSIGYNLFKLQELFDANQFLFDFYVDKLDMNKNVSFEEFCVHLLKVFIFPFIVNQDIVAGYTWACKLIENIFPKNISLNITSNMYYNEYKNKFSIAFKIKLKNNVLTYFYEDGYKDFVVVTSKNIKKSGFNKKI